MTTARWTAALRETRCARTPATSRSTPSVKRAALSEDGRLLFVNHGVDPTRPLDRQGDSASGGVPRSRSSSIAEPFAGVQRAVRGFDRAHPGVASGAVGMTIDGGCGFGGPLLALLLDRDGREIERLSA